MSSSGPEPLAAPDTPSSAPPAHPHGYEFNHEQNTLIGDLASKMKILGTVAMIIGILGLAAGAWREMLDLIINATVTLLSGVWTRTAGDSFAQVVHTKGDDINHLMTALHNLRKLYSLMYWLLVIVLVFFIIILGAEYMALGVKPQ
jgi:hypothetical protein